VFNQHGRPLAVIPVEAGLSNFALTDDAVASIMGETKLYRLDP
jgi:hypothetical protein